MNEILLENIPEEYNLMMKQFNNDKHIVINKILSNYQYSYFRYISNPKEIDKSKYCHDFQDFLFKYLIQFKLISYQYSSIYKNFDCSKSLKPLSEEEVSNQQIDTIFCCEKHCLIIAEVNYSIINNVIQKLKEKDVIFIDVNQNWNCDNEIHEFYTHHEELIKENKFIGYILRPTAGYLIKRYFYPTEYFKDPSFFYNGQIKKANEQKFIQNLNHNLFNDDLINKQQIKKIIKEIKSDNSHIIKSKFYEEDFIILKDIWATRTCTCKLVIHIESLYIYTMKKIGKGNERNEGKFDYEISFCNDHEHRCFVPFYGFLTNESNEKLGFVYEYMANDSLKKLIKCANKNENIYSNISLITTINRLIQGINYLHSNNLFHRDLKPSNILIDHDNRVFINDYETIRYINSQDDSPLTENLGSQFYISPEQMNCDQYSFPTDIFAFGQIIKEIFDKQQTTNKLLNIKELYIKCTKKEADERPNCKEIIQLIRKEINTFHYYVQYLMSEEINQKEMIQFIYEYIQLEDENHLDKYVDTIIDCFKSLYLSKFVFKKEKSLFLFEIGYYYEKYFDLESAKKYYQQSADLQNSDALNNLGLIYQTQNQKNKDEVNDIPKAMYYFEKAAEMNNSFACLNLAYLYYLNIKEIKQDYSKAKEYFEKSAKLNNSFALFNLGNMYNYGEGVEQDYLKARKYYESAAELKNSHAYNNLGYLYYYGKGVTKNILKAEECFRMSAKLNNSHGYFFLGDLLSTGDDRDIDINEAIKWLTKCSKNYFEVEIVQNSIKRYDSILEKINRYRYRSKNDLGLIYLLVYEDVEKAKKLLKKAATNDYSFAKNNYLLL